MSAKTYIKISINQIEKLTETTLKNYGSPLDPGNHPEMDDTYLFPPNDLSLYHMLIGSLQWDVTLGRWGVQYLTNTLTCFFQKPHYGHLK